MSGKRRAELIEAIQQERKSWVIAYVLGDEPGSEGGIGPDAVEVMYRLLCGLKPLEKKPLDLILVAQRGDTETPWEMVGMIRQLFDLFDVIVPRKAHGPATMIALGADTVIMGERGTLSSIEPLVPADDFSPGRGEEIQARSAEDAKAVLSVMESFGRVREKQRIDAFLRLMDKVDPLFMGNLHRRAEQLRTDCLLLLEQRKRRFSAWRNGKIVRHLTSDSACCHRSITRSDAVKNVGLKQVRREDSLEPLVSELLTLYEQELKPVEPFNPEAPAERNDGEEEVFCDRKVACMESVRGTRILMQDIKVQKVREIPGGIRLDPQILLPSLHISPESDEQGVWSFIEGWLQENLPRLIDESLARFQKSLPVAGYKQTAINRRWVDG